MINKMSNIFLNYYYYYCLTAESFIQSERYILASHLVVNKRKKTDYG